jgi:hypothetical protein
VFHKITKIFVFLFFISQTSVFAASSAWTNDMSGTPTVFKVKPNSMMFCESYDITNGSCTGSNDFTFTKHHRVRFDFKYSRSA